MVMEYEISEHAREFWTSAEAGRLVIQECSDCSKSQMYPRRRCVACGSRNLAYGPTSGLGTLYSWTTVVRNAAPAFHDDMPYVLAIVELAEGPRMLTRMLGCSDEELVCDMPVVLKFERSPDNRPLACFKPRDVAGEPE